MDIVYCQSKILEQEVYYKGYYKVTLKFPQTHIASQL